MRKQVTEQTTIDKGRRIIDVPPKFDKGKQKMDGKSNKDNMDSLTNLLNDLRNFQFPIVMILNRMKFYDQRRVNKLIIQVLMLK